MSVAAPAIGGHSTSPLAQSWVLFFGALPTIGMIFGKLARMALDETIGAEADIGDRLGGAVQVWTRMSPAAPNADRRSTP